MSGKRILSDAQIDEMIDLRESGWSCQRIADHFTAKGTKVSVGSISWQCLRVGADVPEKRRGKLTQPTATYQRNGRTVRPFTAEDDALLRVLDMQDFKIATIAKRMDRGSNSIRGRLYTLARRDARAEEASGINV